MQGMCVISKNYTYLSAKGKNLIDNVAKIILNILII